MGNCWSLQKFIREAKFKEFAEPSFRNQDNKIIHEDSVDDKNDQNDDGYQFDDETGDIVLPPRTSLRGGGLEAIPEEPSTDVETGSCKTNIEQTREKN
ncbi:hypothetical protein ACOSQ2_004828 [Xanthoceras sorbifolium]